MTWRVELTRPAEKDLGRLDPAVGRRVIRALRSLPPDPRQAAALTKLVNRDGYRFRVGDWRVLMDVDDHNEVLVIRRILPRGRAYDR